MLDGEGSGRHLTVTAFVVLLVSACMHFCLHSFGTRESEYPARTLKKMLMEKKFKILSPGVDEHFY